MNSDINIAHPHQLLKKNVAQNNNGICVGGGKTICINGRTKPRNELFLLMAECNFRFIKEVKPYGNCENFIIYRELKIIYYIYIM